MNKKLFSLLAVTALLTVAGAAYGATINIPNPLANSGVNNFCDLLTRVSNYILGFIATLAIIVFIWAGILFIISRGDPGKTKDAQNMILYAVIGIGIALAGKGLLGVITAVIGTSGGTCTV